MKNNPPRAPQPDRAAAPNAVPADAQHVGAQCIAPAPARIGLVSVSDRASAGVYADAGIPALREWLTGALVTPWQAEERLIADEQATIEATLKELADECGCCLIFTTGGTGPAPRDVTPEATRAVGERELPGFGEEMRRISRHFVPTAILSRQTAVTRGRCLIVNLPGQPKSIRETLEGVRQPDGTLRPEGLFAAIPYCVELLGGARLETNEAVIRAFRPKKK